MTENISFLTDFLKNSLTAHHAQDNVKTLLENNGFISLSETEDWDICQSGKYFVTRGASLIAFTVGGLDNFSFKIAASHLDSPALKIKENPLIKTANCVCLNTESYGGGLWYTFFDRPLKIAGQIIVNDNGKIRAETVQSPFLVHIPSQALHINRGANDSFAVNVQTDLAPLLCLDGGDADFVRTLADGKEVLAYDLYAVNAQQPYVFGANDEFLASPRIDNLTSVYASVDGLLSHAESDGVCVAAFFHHEEIGSGTSQGAGGDFLENTLRRITYALRFDDIEFDKAMASSFLLSVDNAHAQHPHHPEKSDPTNKTKLGGGIVIKSHAKGAYITNALTSAVVKKIFDTAGVTHQTFYNRSDMRSGSTLGVAALQRTGIYGADIGLAQLAMHSACECFALSDFEELRNGITAFFSSDILLDNDGFIVK